MKNIQVTINDEVTTYDDLWEVAQLFHSSWPAKTPQRWYQELLECFSRGWALVNTGTDGRRIKAERI